jgi:N-acetylglucosamine malate deacetylase 2
MKNHSLLVVLAHPDDESFPMGGTLAKYAAKGVKISLICATRGEAGIPGLSAIQAGRVRERELRAAAAILGVADVQFLDYRDGELAKADTEPIIARLQNIFRQVNPQVTITFGPDGISGHPDHVAISRLVTGAFDRSVQKGILSHSARLYYIAPSEATLQGCGVVPPQEVAGGPVTAIDVGDYLVTKVRAMQSHVSQTPPYPGDAEEEATRLTCHEYFTLARPVMNYHVSSDLFSPDSFPSVEKSKLNNANLHQPLGEM